MFLKGLKFGMLLQLSIGPVCLFVFNTAGEYGFFTGLSAVAAVVVVDALYILIAGTGVSAVIRHTNIQWIIKGFGFAVLLLFGIDTLLGAFGIKLLGGLNLSPRDKTGGLFLQGLLLTASNPLTVLFWSGVFSSEALVNNIKNRQLFFYGLGCISSTLIFLTAVAGLAGLVRSLMPKEAIMFLNIAVGFLLIGFGVRLLIKK